MRIGLIAPPWITVPPRAYGGTESVLDTLACGLAAAGHHVVLATTGDSTCPVERTWVYEQARTIEIGNVTIELRHLLHAYDHLADVDVIHDHTVAGPLLAAQLAAAPVVTTNHGPFTDDSKAIYRHVAGSVPIVAISRHQASTAGGIPIARVIHHGVNEHDYPVGTGAGGYLVFLGRMSPSKGAHGAIDVARRAGLPLLIAAKLREPDEHAYFDSTIAPLLGGDIEYLGEVGGAEKLDLLGGARALLNPIRWDEPFGLSMIEAMACGTPVLTTARGAAPEIVDDGVTGFVCADLDRMVSAVTEIDSIDRRQCREAVETRFSAARMAAEHLELYRFAIARGSGVESTAL